MPRTTTHRGSCCPVSRSSTGVPTRSGGPPTTSSTARSSATSTSWSHRRQLHARLGCHPGPAQGVAAAPEIVAGGLTLTATGEEVAYQIILSDGAASPAAGHPLGGNDLDGRGALVVAFPDLDGDGVIGPTAADGDADNAIEVQETVQLAGAAALRAAERVASGTLAVSLGAPASAGGLGLVVAAGAITGSKPPLYDDAAGSRRVCR